MFRFIRIAGIALLFLMPWTCSGENYGFYQPSGYSSSPLQLSNSQSYFGSDFSSFFGGHGSSSASASSQFPHFSASGFFGGLGFGVCDPQIAPCTKSKYRTYDGSCNNLENPTLGVANTRYGRLLPQKYSDGLQAPPVSVTGHKLTSARQISAVLFPDAKIPDPKWTLALMQYGQIITHDMSLAAGTTQGKAHATRCCRQDLSTSLPKDSRNPACFPIRIPDHDPVYSKEGIQCMEFVRTTNDVSQGCNSGQKAAEQITAVTHYLDSSNVYGSSQQVAESIREFKGGRLRVEVKYGREFPPSNNNKSAMCDHISESEACYLAGDVRVNQNPQLTVFQILQLREHNRLARELARLNPHWDDERLYQEARKINIAQHQGVTYNEWLPIILGRETTEFNGLTYNTKDYTYDYNEKVDPSVLNDHATAAFRFFHTNIAGFLKLIDEHRSSYEALRLSDHFNRPQIIEEGNNFDDLARGMHTQPQEASDKYFTKEITWFLFRNGKHLGQDLRAIDIQRSRDHGLASYNDYRHYCGHPKAQTFEDFGDLIDPESVHKLASLYHHPDDVEFTVGGSLEAIVPGALVGPTFMCIITEQFYRTRTGDRFFFENGVKDASLTLEQVNEIRRGSISRLICDNADDVKSMQARGFEQISHNNPVVPCSLIPAPSLEPWREHKQAQESAVQPQAEDHGFTFPFFKK
ncbi:peroxidase-like [Zootermopsis nevadensis]|uniref:Peroxidase n=1 Tax=Zootermopsis nevadensis TaxID=136037 RepID=A0A067RJX3_ZOONE|nr:peroxidase-like [Zootermopsis nevadensis]XP_021920035.1 peroxidase-like [Zootermopsis nevadensis]XP_021920044.1 peroxidase-like [Zootermopsis nevadensis]KDR24107.1 Peroxidase [Zootermopsis nevadensis]